MLALPFAFFCIATVQAQIFAPNADLTQPTAYTNGMPDDEIFIFCSPDANGNPVQGELTVFPSLNPPGYTFEWGRYNDVTHSYMPILNESGVPFSSITGLQSGGYRVNIMNSNGQVETFNAWVYVSELEADLSLTPDPVQPGCAPFDLEGTVSAVDFTYWDPIDPGAAPFIVDASTEITVCFSANHTYVSDLGFYLVGPPSCGSPTVLLSPNPGANGQNEVCNANSNVNGLCFTTNPAGNFDPCQPNGANFFNPNGNPASNSNYSGSFSSYGPAGNTTPIDWSPIYGCNSAEGGWAVQIYDCIAQDVGALTNATISFSDGNSTIEYSSGGINSAINDNSCTPASASIYEVPLTTPVDPDPQNIPNTGTITYQLGVTGSPTSLPPGTSTFTQTIDPFPTNDEWYYLEITDNFGCTAIDSVMFAYAGAGAANIDDINATNTLCSSADPVQLTAASTGGAWSGNGVDASGLFDPSVAGIGTHSVSYTIAGACGDVGTLDITVSELEVTTSSTPSTCDANNGTATATPTSGTAPFTYSWNTNPAQSTQTATGLGAGDYEATVASADGCSVTVTATVGLDGGDLDVQMGSATDMNCHGICDGSAEVVISGGAAPISILWNDAAAQQTAVATGLCGGNYEVTVTDANSCSVTLQTSISEPTEITVTAVMDVESDCGQPTGEVTATFAGGTVAGQHSVSWNSTPPQNTATATGLMPGEYTVTVTDDNGCEATATVTVTSTPTFTVSITDQSDALCNGDCNGTATAEAGNDAVLPVSFSWNTTPAQTDATAAGLCAGTYVVTVTDDAGCMATTSVTIAEPQAIDITASAANSIICEGQQTQLSVSVDGGTAPLSYEWSSVPSDASLTIDAISPEVSPQEETIYTVTVTDANGCVSAPSSVTVAISGPLALDVVFPANGDTTVCAGQPVSILLLGAGGDGNLTYTLPPAVAPLSMPHTLTSNVTNTYVFEVNDGCGTTPASASVTVNVEPTPVVNFTVDAPAGCEPHTANFTDLSAPSGVQWLWDFGDANSSAGTSTQQNPSFTYVEVGTYDVSLQVTSASGCSSDTTIVAMIEVASPPEASFTATPSNTTLIDPTITFTDQSEGDITGWEWTFGDGFDADVQNPAHTYLDTGLFNVTLIVTSAEGCIDIARRNVRIGPDFMFYIPNSFTPDGDGLNDAFRPYGEGIRWDTFEMFVFDRWGQQVFYTNDIETSWDGMINGNEPVLGVYAYLIHITDENGRKLPFRGNITLLR
jgi:trimeric autotransporter adhesin